MRAMYSTERMRVMYPRGVRAASFCSGGAGTKTAPPTQNCPHSLPPQCQSHLWPSVFRAGPNGWPSALQPRPGAAHSRPEVRTARPPRPGTTAARLRALSSARTDSGWTRTAGPAETRRLAAEGKRPPAAKPAGRRKTFDLGPEENKPRAPDGIRSVRGCHEGCSRLQPQGDVIYRASKTAPAPAAAGPPVLAALKITPPCGQRPCRAWHESLLG
jgi:hypothetical protein